MSKVIHTLITLPIKKRHLKRLQAISERLLITVHPAATAEEVPEEIWQPAHVLFTYRAIPLPEQVPAIRWMQYYLAGVENLLSMPIAQKEDLQITSMSGANAPIVAEHALALLLSLGRQLPYLYDFQIRNMWLENRKSYQPQPLRGSTVGIVGYGSVGRELARLLQPFDVEILVTKSDAMHPEDQGYIIDGLGDPQGGLFSRMYPPQALRSMLQLCDFVVITTPLTKKTRGMFSTVQFKALKPTTYLVDVSRGGVVDHAALLTALQEERLAGAGLDVFPEEPLPVDSLLWEIPNVIVTPHVAGVSPAYLDAAVELFSTNLERYLNDESLLNIVDPKKGY